MHTCWIVGAGDFVPKGFHPEKEDLVIAADGGYAALQALGIQPHLLVGDMDSLAVLPEDVPQIRFPAEKDDTDMGLALDIGYQRGYRHFSIYGGSGSRIDHFLANLQNMGKMAARGCSVRMVCVGYEVYAIQNSTLSLPPRRKGTVVSVFCHGDMARGVTLQGLKYPLENATLTCKQPLGVSNESLGLASTVQVLQGTLLVVVYDDGRTL